MLFPFREFNLKEVKILISVNCYHVGPLMTNCYLVTDEKTQQSLIIDPGGISKELDMKINEIGLDKVKYIVLTHGHFDHIRKVARYKKLTGAKIIANKDEIELINDEENNLSKRYTKGVDYFEVEKQLDDGDEFLLGGSKIKMIKTSGHTKGSACFIVEDCIFSGDTLMKDCIGRCDLPTGNQEDMINSLRKISNFQKNYKIYPGHGEETNLEYEKENNPYLNF